MGPLFDKYWPKEKSKGSKFHRDSTYTTQEQCCSVPRNPRPLVPRADPTMNYFPVSFYSDLSPFSKFLMIGFPCGFPTGRKWTALSALAFEVVWMPFSLWTNKLALSLYVRLSGLSLEVNLLPNLESLFRWLTKLDNSLS